MDLNLKNKIALVTGSSSGIGKAIASTLSKEGCKVILNSLNLDRLQKTASQLNCEYIHGDVSTNEKSKYLIESFIKKYHRLDILVCNVGSGKSKPPGEEDEEEWLNMLRINLFSSTNIIKHAHKYLIVSNGVILCISSICGKAALDAPIAYSGSKAALNSFVQNSARVLAKDGIRINALLPGNINFPGSTWEAKLINREQETTSMIEREVPLKRFGNIDEVATLATVLCSNKIGFVTGALYTIDGGQLRS